MTTLSVTKQNILTSHYALGRQQLVTAAHRDLSVMSILDGSTTRAASPFWCTTRSAELSCTTYDQMSDSGRKPACCRLKPTNMEQ